MDCIPEGFKAMVPAILILTFAWTLKAMTDSLGATVLRRATWCKTPPQGSAELPARHHLPHRLPAWPLPPAPAGAPSAS